MDDRIFSKLSNMLDNSSNPANNHAFANFLNHNANKNNKDNINNFDFSNLDFETINKIKNIMGKFNSNQHSPRTNLLSSLKPYLKPSRREKLDQYIQFANMISIMEAFNNIGDVNK